MSDEMTKDELNRTQYVKKPLSDREMETKLDEVRANISEKMDKWANTVVVSQYISQARVLRTEGERWQENGKTWEMKNGIRMTVSATQDARMPWWCPKCSKSMSHRFDRATYNMRGWCFDCNIEYEHKIRLAGKWPEFERRVLRDRQKGFLLHTIEEYDTYLAEFKAPTVYFEDGRYEVIAEKAQFKQLFDSILADRAILVRRLDEIAEEEATEEPLEVDNDVV